MHNIAIHVPWRITSGLSHMALQLCRFFESIGHRSAVWPHGMTLWDTDDDHYVDTGDQQDYSRCDTHIWIEIMTGVQQAKSARCRTIHIPMSEYLHHSDIPMLSQFDRIVSPTHVAARMCHDQLKLPCRITTIPWSVPVPEHRAARKRDGDIRLLTYARSMRNDKSGLRPLIGAFGALKSNDMYLAVKVSENEGCLDRIMPDVYAGCLDANIDMYSGVWSQETKAEMWSQFDFYVTTPRREGIGLTILEAMANGLPVITLDHPPMNEFVTDGWNGILIRPVIHDGRFRLIDEVTPAETSKVTETLELLPYVNLHEMRDHCLATAKRTWNTWQQLWATVIE